MTVAAFVAIEAEPQDVTWIELCAAAGVVLVWPAMVGRALRDLTS